MAVLVSVLLWLCFCGCASVVCDALHLLCSHRSVGPWAQLSVRLTSRVLVWPSSVLFLRRAPASIDRGMEGLVARVQLLPMHRYAVQACLRVCSWDELVPVAQLLLDNGAEVDAVSQNDNFVRCSATIVGACWLVLLIDAALRSQHLCILRFSKDRR